ncbi:sulfurtransferase-like selenium metabolism protein YedF [Saccharomonospora viridis]|uniref:sulfurtransferase-like selenium metabolism protein YedF n=1 Tax=Saccharomonospora viridis TaxID=1852 RepID=UPI0023EFCA36|nr:sulfurtransferase-like selenium metabolism protein YedF [Saccharomonospora viridis]
MSDEQTVRSIEADYRLDIRGEVCPYPVIYSLEALATLEAGQVLEVVADCPQSFRNVPEEAVKHGYQLVREPQRCGADLRFLLRVPE